MLPLHGYESEEKVTFAPFYPLGKVDTGYASITVLIPSSPLNTCDAFAINHNNFSIRFDRNPP